MKKKIAVISCILSFFTVLNIFVNPFRFGEIKAFTTLFNCKTFEFLTVSFGDLDSLIMINTNYLNILFALLFVVGTIKYIKSNYNEVRLLRFIYAVLLLNLILFIPLNVFYTYKTLFSPESFDYFRPKPFDFTFLNILRLIFSYVYTFGLIFIVYRFLTYFNTFFQIKFTEKQTEDSTFKIRFEATKTERFFHHIIDSIVWGTIFYTFISNLLFYRSVQEIFSKAEIVFGERFSLILLLFVFKTIYYFFFEIQFRATPAKFLTQTRVMGFGGKNVGFTEIVKRTLARSIPFDAVAFLFGMFMHDSISNTKVLQEVEIDE